MVRKDVEFITSDAGKTPPIGKSLKYTENNNINI